MKYSRAVRQERKQRGEREKEWLPLSLKTEFHPKNTILITIRGMEQFRDTLVEILNRALSGFGIEAEVRGDIDDLFLDVPN